MKKTDTSPSFNHFVVAQNRVYDQVIAELFTGKKTTHWMWFIFPQLIGLGRSKMSLRFAIHSLQGARAYLSHPIVGPRLVHCTQLVLAISQKNISEIFDEPDDMKFHSSMSLFALATPEIGLFEEVLEKYVGGTKDPATFRLLKL